MISQNDILLVTAFGVGATAISTGLAYLHKLVVKPNLKYRIDDIKDTSNLHINLGDQGIKDMGQILGKTVQVENIGNRASNNVTIHIRTHSRLIPKPHISTSIADYRKNVRGNEIYIYCNELRAKGGRITVQIFVLKNDLELLNKPFIADFEISDSRGHAKVTKILKYIRD